MSRLEALMTYLMRGNRLFIKDDFYSYNRLGFCKNGTLEVSNENLVSLAYTFEFNKIYEVQFA